MLHANSLKSYTRVEKSRRVKDVIQSPTSLTHVEPESVGLSPRIIARLDADMEALVTENKRAGIVSVIARRGKIVHFRAHGWRNMEKALPMELDTICRIYSMTRAVTAVGLLSLYDEGKFRFDDPVSQYIPEFSETRVLKEIRDGQIVSESQQQPITLRNLFTYTSGLGYPSEYPDFLGLSFEKTVGLGDTIENGMRALAGFPLLFQPGDHWHYGFSGDVLGRVAEVISGQPYDQFLKQRIFDPLRLIDTGFFVPADQWDRLAEAYTLNSDGKLENATKRLPTLNSYREGETIYSGGGGLVSTAGDYLRFGQMLLNEGELDDVRILKPETVKLMVRNHLTNDQGPLMSYAKGRGTPDDPWTASNGYGWGLSIGVRLDGETHTVPGGKGEFRWDGLANTTYFIDPENEIVAIAMSQYLGPKQDELDLTLRRHLYGAVIDR